MFLDSIEEYFASLPESERQAPAVARALDEIARDRAARDRYLVFARDADQPAIRVRMMKLAQDLGWLSPAELRAELLQMIGELLARDSIGAADLDLVCSLNDGRELDGELNRLQLSPAQVGKTDHAVLLACLGSAAGRARVLEALTSADDREVELAQVYLYHRPITDIERVARRQQGDREHGAALPRRFAPSTHSPVIVCPIARAWRK